MRVAVLTTGRQDWSLLSGVAQALRRSDTFALTLLAAGMHPTHQDGGPTVLDGIPVDAVLPTLPPTDDGPGVADAAAQTTSQVAHALAKASAEALLIAGDRTETLGAALAATCLRLPIIHLHGGEETVGAVDNACRHAITKLSHLHCVAHPLFAQRVLQLGESPHRVVVTGAPGLDAARAVVPIPRPELAQMLGVTVESTWVLCTHHPTTLGAMAPAAEMACVLGALHNLQAQDACEVLFTRPNVDVGGAALARMVEEYVATHAGARLHPALGTTAYVSMLREAALMVGNSSSGIIEAPLFQLPVVNVGDRQAGRLRGSNVIDVPVHEAAILAGCRHGLSSGFRASLHGTTSPYGDGHAVPRIIQALQRVAPDLLDVRKAFVDLKPA